MSTVGSRLFGRLVVFTGQVEHFDADGRVLAHGGFVKEMEIWAPLFKELLVVCPSGDGLPLKGDEIPYRGGNISFVHLSSAIRRRRRGFAKLTALRHHVISMVKCFGILRKDDVVMSRGPDGIGMTGLFLARMKNLRHMGKYAAQWNDGPGEPLSYRIQKAIYRSSWLCRGPVQIYGAADPDRRHLVPFFTSSVTSQRFRDLRSSAESRFERPPSLRRIVYVGRLFKNKGVDTIIQAMNQLGDQELILDVVGTGPFEQRLKEISKELGLRDQVHFHGWKNEIDLHAVYEKADLLVFASRREGFGKVLVEAMCYGLPIAASDVGMNREILGPDYPLLFDSESPKQLAEHFRTLCQFPDSLHDFGRALRQRLETKRYFLDQMRSRYLQFLQQLRSTNRTGRNC